MLSSQIEGTQSSLSDLLLFENEEAPGVPLDDVEETSNYISAMTTDSADRVRRAAAEQPPAPRGPRAADGGRPRRRQGAGRVSAQPELVGGTRPGNARFVPPPAHEVARDERPGEVPARRPVPTPILVKAALAHVQFETIHPFLDGNGRVGRLLITLLLCAEKVLQQPLLYLSLYFKQHRDAYYDHLQRVRTEGAWEAWLAFFLEGVISVRVGDRDGAAHPATRRGGPRAVHDFGRGAASALRVHELAGHRIVLTASRTATELGLSVPTVNAALARLEQAGILREVTGRKRGRLFVYDAYLSLLQAEV